MKISLDGTKVPHCCDCGSMQLEFDIAQHNGMCAGIRREQEWTTCPFHTPQELAAALQSAIWAIDNLTE